MDKKRIAVRDWLVHLAKTILLCSLIALVTKIFWSGPYLMHLSISLVYGGSAVVAIYLIAKFWPNLSVLQASLIGSTIALILGSLNLINTLKNQYPNGQILTQLNIILGISILINVLVFLFFYINHYRLLAERSLQQAKVMQAEMERNLMLSQLQQLQSQMEPHFLFNTLANIDALIDSNPSLARHLLLQLNDLLRATLKNNSQAVISLTDEVALLNAYLQIQQVRLGERFNYHIECNLGNLQQSTIMLPPFLIQPLVENAISHGIEPKNNQGEIIISFSVKDDCLLVCVQDNGVGLRSDMGNTGHGIGLVNIRQRLEVLMPNAAGFKLYQTTANTTVAELSMPLDKLNAQHGVYGDK